MDEIGKRIKKIRNQKNYTQRQLGEILNIDYSHISKIERGDRTPSIELLERLSELFDVRMSYFFGEEHPLPKELKDEGVEWLVFKDEINKRNLTPKEIIDLLDLIDKLNNK